MEGFSLSPPLNLSEVGEWLLAVTCFEATNSVFILAAGNNSFSILTLGYWSPRGNEETIDKLSETLELTFQNDIEVHLMVVEKRGKVIMKISLNPILILINMRFLKN